MTERATVTSAEAATPRSLGVRLLRGASVWRAAPVALLEAELRDPGMPRADVETLVGRLADAIPTLGERATLVDQLVAAAAPSVEAVLLVAVELQRLAGAGTPGGRVAPAGDPGTWAVAVEYEEESVGTASLRFALEAVELGLRGEAPEIDAMVAGLRRRLRRDRPDADTAALIAEARRRGIPVRREAGEPVVQLGTGRFRRTIDGSRTSLSSATGSAVAADPVWLRRALERFEIPVPTGDSADSLDDALDAADDLGYPVVVKSADGDGAVVTSPRIDDAAALRSAFREMHSPRSTVIVERWVEGDEHRLLFVDGRLVAVAGPDPKVPIGVEQVDSETAALLGFAADALELGVARFTVRTDAIDRPFRDSRGTVVGLSARPSLGGFAGAVPALVDALFPPGAPSRVPIVAVTGTNGKTTTTRLVAHLLGASGKRVGFTSTDGVYFDGRLLFEGDMTGPMAADIVLSNPRVEAAALETARGGILRAGVGFDECDVAVVLNVSADHMGIGGIHSLEQLAEVKGVLPTLVRPGGFAVLNADDAHVLAMRGKTRGAIALFSMKGGEEVRRHIDAGGPALVVEDDTFVLYRGGEREVLMPVAEAPLTIRGAARFQVANASAALLAASCAGVGIDALRSGLLSFTSTTAATPGRMNVLCIDGATVIVDYAHNEAAVRALVEFGRRVPAARRMAVIGAPGDRRDEDIRQLGAIAVGLDFVIFREASHYRRGRAPGEIANLLADGYSAAGGDRSKIAIVPDEDAAIADMLTRIGQSDLVLLMAAESARAIETLRKAGAVDG